jgi:hypothetical protein
MAIVVMAFWGLALRIISGLRGSVKGENYYIILMINI